jgi:lipopolysaccharide/colanic/teichoic acid biosynthesis glycosyltransferase
MFRPQDRTLARHKTGGLIIYPHLAAGILDVEQIDWQQKKVLALVPPRSLIAAVEAWVKKYIIDPLLFLLISGVLLLVPQRLMLALSHGGAHSIFLYVVIRSIDIVGACVGFLFAIPFFLFVPLLIKWDTPGPVFYKQIRTGYDRRRRERRVAGLGSGVERRRLERRQRDLYGKPFFIYKFRTMSDGAENGCGAVWATNGDPRITKVGQWLRKYHIDEIPQFWNVLHGDMSLVGPRPERPEIINKLISDIPHYRQRLLTKPGLTGLAQVCGGYDSCLEDVKRKIHMDLSYISNLGLSLYVRILCQTVSKILSSNRD